jgi:hypothetical protein
LFAPFGFDDANSNKIEDVDNIDNIEAMIKERENANPSSMYSKKDALEKDQNQ